MIFYIGTTQWKGGGKGYEELSDSMLQQMVNHEYNCLSLDW